jgi:hypothetical protein
VIIDRTTEWDLLHSLKARLADLKTMLEERYLTNGASLEKQ